MDQVEGERALQGVQVGVDGALAGGELEVAGEVGQGPRRGGQQLSWRPGGQAGWELLVA